MIIAEETGANSVRFLQRRLGSFAIAQRSERNGEVVYTFDVRLQDTPDAGAETVFFDV